MSLGWFNSGCEEEAYINLTYYLEIYRSTDKRVDEFSESVLINGS